MRIPSKIVAGDAVQWTDRQFMIPWSESPLDINAGSFTLQYVIVGPNGAGALTLDGASDGTGWDFAISNAQSSALNPVSGGAGMTAVTWWWQAFATAIEGGNRIRAGNGQLTVEPNLPAIAAAGLPYSGLSLAEQQLAMVDAEITARLSNHARTEYTIGNRHLKFEPMEKLVLMKNRLMMDIARQKTAQAVANGLGNPGKAMVRFSKHRGSGGNGWWPSS